MGLFNLDPNAIKSFLNNFERATTALERISDSLEELSILEQLKDLAYFKDTTRNTAGGAVERYKLSDNLSEIKALFAYFKKNRPTTDMLDQYSSVYK